MLEDKVKYAVLLCVLVLLAGCSNSIGKSSELAAVTTSAISDTAPMQSTVTTGDPNGYKYLFKERFAEARKVGLHYTATNCWGRAAAPEFSEGDTGYYKCVHYKSRDELRTATTAVFTDDFAQGFFTRFEYDAFIERDGSLYIAPRYLFDASVWQAEDTISFQDQTVDTFLWDSLTITEAGDDTISYTMNWYQTYPGDPLTSVFTLVRGGDGLWRFDMCFGNEVTPLTAEEVEQYNKAFEPELSDEEGNRSVNTISHFFTSYYDRPEDINLTEFLRYFPSGEGVTDAAEFVALKAHENWPFGVDAAMDGLPVPIHKIYADAVNEALKKYMGITLDDLSGVGTEELIYLEKYDAYYNYTSDFAAGFFVCTRGERQGDIIRLYGDYATLTLKFEGDGYGYLIVSHQKTGESEASQEEKIRALVQTSLDIQYEHKAVDLDLVYTKEFYNNFPDYYYKDNLAPCKITNYDFMTTLTETDDGELVVAVRVEDKQGSYIQVIHMIKNESSYLISNIEYDA